MTILDTIVAEKQSEIARWAPRRLSADDLRQALAARGGVRDFMRALRSGEDAQVAVIAEVKKASPSAGVIRESFDAVGIAREFEQAGASCLSVLTDRKFFQGDLTYLRSIRESVNLPLLRKDFVIDERQIMEAVEWGADAILLIVAILDDPVLKRLHELGQAAGLTVLVEVHDETELDRALAIGAPLIGVNNRDLKSFRVDLATTERLAARLPQKFFAGGGLLVAESGIRTRADVERVAQCGARAILVGESLMRETNISFKLHELRGVRR